MLPLLWFVVLPSVTWAQETTTEAEEDDAAEDAKELEAIKAVVKEAVKEALEEQAAQQAADGRTPTGPAAGTATPTPPPPAPAVPQAPNTFTPAPSFAPPPPGAPVGGPPPLSRRIQPVGEFRFSLLGDNLERMGNGSDTERMGLSFTVPRAVFGFRADLGPYVDAVASLNLVEKRDTEEVPFTTEAGDTGTVAIPVGDSGWVITPWDLYADFDPGTDGDVRIRAGVHKSVFSTRDLFDLSGGYYMGTPSYATLAQVAGVIPSRDLGVTGTFWAADDDLQIDAQIVNGPGYLEGEDNPEKDFNARVGYTAADAVTARVSVLYGARGLGAFSADTMGSASVEVKQERFRIIGEILLGSLSVADDDDESVPVLGAQAAGSVSFPLESQAFEELRILGRTSSWDPNSEQPDATGWLLHEIATQLWWKTGAEVDESNPTSLVTLLGYEMFMPVNIELPVEHTLVLQAVWAF